MNKTQQKGNKREFAGFPGDKRKSEIDDKIGDKKITGEDHRRRSPAKIIGEDHRQRAGRGHGSWRGNRQGRGVPQRGRFDLMQYIHGFIACLLVLLALIHIPFPEPLAWLPYSIAAGLAFLTLKSELSLPVSRVLAIATTGMMFFFFALFFLVVPTLSAGWYTTQYGWAAVCLLLSAFVMIPILSDYSCRLKAPCREARAARRTAFFSVPSHINPESR
ncbi:MAG: hypothetical protein EP301_14260 [Gammaproteobacteria bacterium]|nr:MAG: hypothetical protein EP301_14260 [Gammaproteobacteria bacterium]